MSRLHHAWLYRVDVSLEGTTVSIDSMHLCLKPFQSMFTCVEMEKSLVNFSVNLAKSSPQQVTGTFTILMLCFKIHVLYVSTNSHAYRVILK